MKNVSRNDHSHENGRSDAFDAGDVPENRELDVGYLDQVTPPHVKAALAAKRKVLKTAPPHGVVTVVQTADDLRAAKSATRAKPRTREITIAVSSRKRAVTTKTVEAEESYVTAAYVEG